MHNRPSPPGELSSFVEMVMSERTFELYRHDVSKLLVLLTKTLCQSPLKPWYRGRHDPLGEYCHYLVVKMSYDHRKRVVEGIPSWLNVLAGGYDAPGFGNESGKVRAFLGIAAEIQLVTKKYGPDSAPTMRPPPGVE